MTCQWEVVTAGPCTLVQDRGRPGMAHLGVSRSGAADRAAHAAGQRLVGNGRDAAALEVTLGGLVVRTTQACVIAVTGAAVPVQVDDYTVAHHAPVLVFPQAEIRVGATTSSPRTAGLRSYVSVRGGIDVPSVLGSRSTDTLSGLGPAPVRDGDMLPVGEPDSSRDIVLEAAPRWPHAWKLRVVPGPRSQWLADPDAIAGTWTVSERSDRVGIRLEGAVLDRHADRQGSELPTEAMPRGAIQVPPSGEPVLFLADHPVTGGYPVVAVVLDEDTDLAAQAAPGDEIQLQWA